MITKEDIRKVQASDKVLEDTYQFFNSIPEEQARKILKEITRFDLGGHINDKVVKGWIIGIAIRDVYVSLGRIPENVNTAYEAVYGERLNIMPSDLMAYEMGMI